MKRKKKKRTQKKGRLWKVLLIEGFIILLLVGAVKLFDPLRSINIENSDDDKIEVNEDTNEDLKGYRNFVVFGVDSRDNKLEKHTHSDTIMIVSINNKTKDIKLASIYRDTYVNIPEIGYDKINHSYFKGGYSLALSSINTNFDLNIKEYVTVNFKALINAIDRLGGITLDIQENELKYLNGYVRELNRINNTDVPALTQAGTQTVNGTQATAYARIRYTAGGDFKRTERQRTVINQMLAKVKSSDIATINTLIKDIFPQVYTNMSMIDLLSIAKDALSFDIADQTGFPFENSAHYYKDVSYVFPIHLEANVSQLHKFLFGTEDYLPTQRVKDYSDHIESIRKQ